ncbi:hypothetical protein K0U27_02755 [archaeon]|nr:hypothetical protein [archaeon]
MSDLKYSKTSQYHKDLQTANTSQTAKATKTDWKNKIIGHYRHQVET